MMKKSPDKIFCFGKECEFPNTCIWNKRCMLKALNDSLKNKKVKKAKNAQLSKRSLFD
jgi:hypothetical protein